MDYEGNRCENWIILGDFIGFIIVLAGIVTDYWAKVTYILSSDIPEVEGNYGLWYMCAETCKFNNNMEDSHLAVLVLCIVSIVISVIGANLRKWFHGKTFYVIGLTYLFAGVLIVVALITFSSTFEEVTIKYYPGRIVKSVTLDYSFILCCVGNSISIIAALVSFYSSYSSVSSTVDTSV